MLGCYGRFLEADIKRVHDCDDNNAVRPGFILSGSWSEDNRVRCVAESDIEMRKDILTAQEVEANAKFWREADRRMKFHRSKLQRQAVNINRNRSAISHGDKSFLTFLVGFVGKTYRAHKKSCGLGIGMPVGMTSGCFRRASANNSLASCPTNNSPAATTAYRPGYRSTSSSRCLRIHSSSFKLLPNLRFNPAVIGISLYGKSIPDSARSGNGGGMQEGRNELRPTMMEVA